MSYARFRKALSFSAYHFWADFRLRLTWKWWLQQFLGLTAVIALGALSYLLISHFIFQSVKVSGTSMYPTLNAGNYWLDRFVYLDREPQRTDVVAAVDPQDGTLVVKRIIGLPGESIYLHDGYVFVNGRRLKEFYLPAGTRTYAFEKNENELIVCGNDQYFLMGDNRNYSLDSRVFGPVSRKDILGEVVP